MHATTGSVSKGRFRLFFAPDTPIDIERLLTLVTQGNAPFRMVPPNGLEMVETLSEGIEQLPEILAFLRKLEATIFDSGSSRESN